MEIIITIIQTHAKIDCAKLEYFELKYPIGKKDDLKALIKPPKFKKFSPYLIVYPKFEDVQLQV